MKKISLNTKSVLSATMKFIENRIKNEFIYISIFMIISLVVFYKSPIHGYKGSDPLGTLLVSQSIIKHGQVTLDTYPDEVLDSFYWQIYKKNGHIYYSYPLGPSVYSLPFVALANLFHKDMAIRRHELIMQGVLASLTATIAFLLIYLLARCYFKSAASILLSLVLVYGSSISSTMGIALWNINFTVVFILWSLLLLVYDSKDKKKTNPYLLGFLLFSAFFCRPTAAIFIFCVLVYLLVTNKIVFIKVAITAFLFFIAHLLFSLHVYGSFYPGAYSSFIFAFSHFYWSAFYGHLLSPSRGLLVYSPFLILTVIGIFFFIKQLYKNLLFWTVFTGFVLHFLFLCRWEMWYGGGAYGYRLLTDGYPYLVLLTLLVFENIVTIKIQIWRRFLYSLFALLSIFSIFVHTFQGLYNPHTIQWNHFVIKDQTEDLLFNWNYPQFLASDVSLVKMATVLEFRSFNEIYILGDTVWPDSEAVVFDNWYAVERYGTDIFRWSAHKAARVWFNIKGGNELNPFLPLVLEVKASTYGAQTIEVIVNGNSIGFIKSDGSKLCDYKFTFCANLLGDLSSDQAHKVFIEFLIPGAISPAKVNSAKSKDKRTIGIALYELRLRHKAAK